MNMELRDKTALDYLNSRGRSLQVIDRAWKGTNGTLDAVYEDRGTLVAVVFTNTVYRLSQARIKRARELAVAWMNAHGRRFERIRVDIVAVTLLPMGQSNIEHIQAVDS